MPDWMAYGQTDRGKSRPSNQDALLLDNSSRLWAIADGMGGHPGGDIASRLVIETLAHAGPTLRAPTAIDSHATPADMLNGILQKAHEAILRYSATRPQYAGMGTTLVAAHLSDGIPPKMLIANIGDSRAYLVRERSISQMTRDHTLVDEYIRRGYLTIAQAATHPERHVLSRAMGLGSVIDVDLFSTFLKEDDIILLCSDGLTKMLSDAQMLSIILAHQDRPERLPSELIASALDEGGVDNVTVVVCGGFRPSTGNSH
jgi:protein phosphatase